MQIVGFTGLEGAGKDTAARFGAEWAESIGLTSARRGFADKLKVSAARSIGYPSEAPDEAAIEFMNALKERGRIIVDIPLSDEEREAGMDESMTTEGFSGRDFLRWYGTEGHREVFSYSFWPDALFAEFTGGWDEPNVLFIPDTRFDNEAQAIEKRGGVVVEIHKPGVAAVGNHVSEAGLSDGLVTCSVVNDSPAELWGTPDDNLRKGVFSTLSALLLRNDT